MYKNFIKWALDLFVSLFAFLVLLPLFILVFLILLFVNRGNAFFRQVRPGKDDNLFSVIKFKTMNNKEDAQGILLHDSERLTALGKFVRKTSLDEIAQLLNVLI